MTNRNLIANPYQTVGVIPARKGSKRLPGKNTRMLGGKPLIAWTIEAARQSQYLTHLACSTDDEAVMRICVDRGVDVIVRPAELATDEARSEDVVLHALGLYPCDYVCLLQPTSPFRVAEDIDDGIVIALRYGGAVSTEAGLVHALGAAIRPNGAVYVAQVGGPCRLSGVAYFMPPERSIDIDTLEDFERAERMVGVLA